MLEGSAFHAGSAIQWLQHEIGMIDRPHECDILAESVSGLTGRLFCTGLLRSRRPLLGSQCPRLLFGLTRGTDKSVLCRAVLEAIAFEVTDLVETMNLDAGTPITELRADGGCQCQ